MFQDQYVYIHDCISDAIKQGLHLPPGETTEHIYSNQEFEPDDPEEIEQEALYENFNPNGPIIQGNEEEEEEEQNPGVLYENFMQDPAAGGGGDQNDDMEMAILPPSSGSLGAQNFMHGSEC